MSFKIEVYRIDDEFRPEVTFNDFPDQHHFGAVRVLDEDTEEQKRIVALGKRLSEEVIVEEGKFTTIPTPTSHEAMLDWSQPNNPVVRAYRNFGIQGKVLQHAFELHDDDILVVGARRSAPDATIDTFEPFYLIRVRRFNFDPRDVLSWPPLLPQDGIKQPDVERSQVLTPRQTSRRETSLQTGQKTVPVNSRQ